MRLQSGTCILLYNNDLKILISIFLTHGSNNDNCCSDEITALYYAGKHGQLQITKRLIDHNANVNTHNCYRQTELMDSI